MRCEEFKANLFEFVDAPPGHEKECASCAAELASMQQTMKLLDEWQVPEPSPYFNTRLKARLREEAAQAQLGWRERLAALFRHARVPVMAAALGGIVLGGVTVYHSGKQATAENHTICATADLQTLDKNYDLLKDLDQLDDNAQQVQLNDADL
jgi:hypothetical protein